MTVHNGWLSLTDALASLHARAGAPSSRQIAARTIADNAPPLSHTTVNQVIQGRRLAGWPVVERIVVALGGDVDEIRDLWVSAYREEVGGKPPEPSFTPQPRPTASSADLLVELRAIRALLEKLVEDRA